MSPPATHTTLRAGKSFPRIFTDGTICYDSTKRAFFSEAPTSHHVALTDPAWKQAMQQEFDALKQNKTWTLVP